MMNKIAAVVVLYRPEATTFTRNIPSYGGLADCLIIVDNTEGGTALPHDLYSLNKNTVYIGNGNNEGIAKALNRGAQEALRQGCEWLLTMDQDSWFNDRDINLLLKSRFLVNTKATAIIAPVHVEFYEEREPAESFTQAPHVMASGNLLNLSVYKQIGGFREDYFIDYVDNEYCFRARKFNFKILIYNNALLNHNLGASQKLAVPLYGHVVFYNHSPLRKYYLVRNLLYFRKEYGPYFKKDLNKMITTELKVVLKIFLFEKQKLKKILMILRGIKDYKKGITGKYVG